MNNASSLFLWEDTADSEVDRLLSHPHQLESAVDDPEDARSCSCDDYATDRSAVDLQDDGDGDEDRAVGSTGDDARSSHLDETRPSGATLEYSSEEDEEEEEESNNNVGAIRDMNEMEDKLFWDTCMEGGYP
ncbi:hypothetical protein SDJN03_25680, partial [Cucurbita argyrosperma subsp. sororia]